MFAQTNSCLGHFQPRKINFEIALGRKNDGPHRLMDRHIFEADRSSFRCINGNIVQFRQIMCAEDLQDPCVPYMDPDNIKQFFSLKNRTLSKTMAPELFVWNVAYHYSSEDILMSGNIHLMRVINPKEFRRIRPMYEPGIFRKLLNANPRFTDDDLDWIYKTYSQIGAIIAIKLNRMDLVKRFYSNIALRRTMFHKMCVLGRLNMFKFISSNKHYLPNEDVIRNGFYTLVEFKRHDCIEYFKKHFGVTAESILPQSRKYKEFAKLKLEHFLQKVRICAS